MHACIVGLMLRYNSCFLFLSAISTIWELSNSFFSVLLLTFVLFFEQKMQKMLAKGSECASFWGGFSFLTCGTILLSGIRNFLGCYSEVIIFMVWSRCSCKLHYLILLCQTILSIALFKWNEFSCQNLTFSNWNMEVF